MKRYVVFLVSALAVLAAACGVDDRGSQPTSTSTPGAGTPTATPSTGTPTATATPTATRDQQVLQAQLDTARDRWELHRPREYEFDFQWMCFCVPGYTDPVRVRVLDGQIVSIKDPETGEDVTPPQPDSFKTVDGLFDWMEEKVQDDTYSETVEYDLGFSYPTRFDDDPMAHAVDAGKSFTISSFRSITEHVKQAELREKLDQARARWELHGPDSYEFDFQWTCWCTFASNDPVRIMVEDGEITSVTDPETGEPAPEPNYDLNRYMTIDGLLDLIESEIDRPADVLEVEYERDFGYPVSAEADNIINAIDDERSFRVTRFRPHNVTVDLDEVRAQVDAARMKWSEAGYQNYSFEFWWECFCPPDYTKRVKVEVRGGQVASVTDAETGEPHEISDDNLSYRTVDELFAWIERQLERTPEFVDLEFDPETGFPTKAHFDYVVDATDDEQVFFAAELEQLDIHAETQEALDAARAKWEAAGLSFYKYEFNWSCFCLDEFTAQMVVTVQDGVVTSVVKVSDGTPVSEDIFDNFVTVDGLFDRLQDAIDQDAASIQVEFDEETGLPVSASIDYNRMMADEEIAWQAGGLEEITN